MYALEARGAYSRIVRLYPTAELCVEHARPGCRICEVPEDLCSNLEQQDTERLLVYIDNLPQERVIHV